MASSSSSSSSAQLRLMSDLKSIVNEPPEGCSASPMSDNNLFVWGATIFGPDETPWEGGVFCLRLTFSDNYPEKPPRVRFTSDIFHPNASLRPLCSFSNFFPQFPLLDNVSLGTKKADKVHVESPYFEGKVTVYHDGTLCMDIIQDAWSPCHNVATILTSIQSLLTDPNPSSPANPEAAQLLQHDIPAYNKRVRRCARNSTECS